MIKNLPIIFCLGILIGAISVCIYFLYFADIKQMVTFKYISQDELLTLEKSRIKSQENNNIFFGKPDRAVELTIQLIKQHENRKTRVLLTESSIIGDNVESISREIHSQVIKRLQNEG